MSSLSSPVSTPTCQFSSRSAHALFSSSTLIPLPPTQLPVGVAALAEVGPPDGGGEPGPHRPVGAVHGGGDERPALGGGPQEVGDAAAGALGLLHQVAQADSGADPVAQLLLLGGVPGVVDGLGGGAQAHQDVAQFVGAVVLGRAVGVLGVAAVAGQGGHGADGVGAVVHPDDGGVAVRLGGEVVPHALPPAEPVVVGGLGRHPHLGQDELVDVGHREAVGVLAPDGGVAEHGVRGAAPALALVAVQVVLDGLLDQAGLLLVPDPAPVEFLVDEPAGLPLGAPEVVVLDVEVATPGGAVAEVDPDGALAPGGGHGELGDGVQAVAPLGEEEVAADVPVALHEGLADGLILDAK